ncbi:MAG: hypothetical protein ABSH49_03575 [Bryobacteraceae bacterium]
MHVHAAKGDAECKYWIHAERFDITGDFEYNCTPRLRRQVRQIIFLALRSNHPCLAGALWRESCQLGQIRFWQRRSRPRPRRSL